MDKKKADIVWGDSNLIESGKFSKKSATQDDPETHDEKSSFQSLKTMPNRRMTTLKPILFASLSAVAIGAILGVLLLTMFTQSPKNPENAQTINPKHAENTHDEKQTSETNSYDLSSMSAHVLQVGLFTEKGNAEKWFAIYEDAQIPTFIWEGTDGFYLLAGLFKTEDRAKQATVEIKAAGFDVFTKPWTSEEVEVTLTEQEYEWLQAMDKQWNASLTSLQDQGDLQRDAWSSLLADVPSEMPHIESLVEHIEQVYNDEMADANTAEGQMLLLSIWSYYDKLATD